MTDLQNVPGYVDSAYLQRLAELVRPVKQRSYEVIELAPGMRVLDLGCGPGTDTIPMGRIVGSGGAVWGLDHDSEMVEEADRLAAAAGVEDWVHHLQGDAGELPFEDGWFDACRSERLLQHLAEPGRAMAELVRVTRPGGKVVVTDTDHSSVSIANDFPETEWKLRRTRVDMLADGYAGRNLYGYFRKCRLEDIVVEVFPLIVTDHALGRYLSIMDVVERMALEIGVLSEAEVDSFNGHLRDLEVEGRFFGYGIMLMAAGRKPQA